MGDNNSPDNDRAVKSTADDATLAKLSCVNMGYYQDTFIQGMSLGSSGLVNKSNINRANNRAVNSTEPIIRRGTHARVVAVDRAIDAFLSLPLSSSQSNTNNNDDDSARQQQTVNATTAQLRQIVVLGAGRDTTYLRYRFQKEKEKQNQLRNVNWYEVDHSSIIISKAHSWLPQACCKSSEYDVKSTVNEDYDGCYAVSITSKKHNDNDDDQSNNDDNQQTTTSSTSISTTTSSSNYHLIGHDLRSPPSTLFDKLTHPHHSYSTSIPTLFIFECVLMYLPHDTSCELLRYIATSPTTDHNAFVNVVIYDPIPSNDRFGELMIHNLQKVGIVGGGRKQYKRQQQHRGGSTSGNMNDNNEDDTANNSQQQQQQQQQLLSLEKTRTLHDQLTKLIQSNFDIAIGCDMMTAYDYGVISTNERKHANTCEMLDELEEFVLLMKHSCLVGGSVSSSSSSERDGMCNNGNNRCIGSKLCKVGKDSAMGFQDGKCMVLHREKQNLI